MNNTALAFPNYLNPICPCKDIIDDDDHYCYAFGSARYPVLDERSPSLGMWLADCGGLNLNEIKASNVPVPSLPPFIPVIPHSSAALFTKYMPPVVGVMLGEILSRQKLFLNNDIHSVLRIPKSVKIIVFCYGWDTLIENLWPKQKELFKVLSSQDIFAITSVNYSIYYLHPHIERCINIKKSFITYRTLFELGLPAILHISWSGRTDVRRISEWINQRPEVTTLATNLQTLSNPHWQRNVDELKYLVELINRPIHFLISGPSGEKRIDDIKKILPTFTLANGNAAQLALSRHLLDDELHSSLLLTDRSLLLQKNVEQYTRKIISPLSKPLSLEMNVPPSLAHKFTEVVPRTVELRPS